MNSGLLDCSQEQFVLHISKILVKYTLMASVAQCGLCAAIEWLSIRLGVLAGSVVGLTAFAAVFEEVTGECPLQVLAADC